MTFKTAREQLEFGKLNACNPNLYNLLNCLDVFVICELQKQITITSIHRTPEENKAVGAVTDVHVVWHAADISVHDFNEIERSRILCFCNNNFTYRGTKGKQVAIIHTVPGGAEHLHVQYF